MATDAGSHPPRRPTMSAVNGKQMKPQIAQQSQLLFSKKKKTNDTTLTIKIFITVYSSSKRNVQFYSHSMEVKLTFQK